MLRRSRVDLETRLIRARDAIAAQAAETKSLYSRTLSEARDHASDPVAAGAALEVIAVRRLFRLDEHPTFEAFLAAELGISRMTAYRLRQRAARPSAEQRAADAAARDLRARLRSLGGGAWCVETVMRPKDVARVPSGEAKPRRR